MWPGTAMIAVHKNGPQKTKKQNQKKKKKKTTPKPFPISFNLAKFQGYHIVNEFYFGSNFVWVGVFLGFFPSYFGNLVVQ